MEENKRFKIRFDVIGLVGILIGLAGLYTYYKGTKPRLEISVDSVTNVVDVNEKVAGLGVTFNNEDLLVNNKALAIYSISVRNSGNESLRKGDFDTAALVGVRLENATVLSAQVSREKTTVGTYLRANAKLLYRRPSSVYLSPVILDPGDRIGIRVVAIHDARIVPAVHPLGKVVGQNNIPVTIATSADDNRSIWEKAYGGGVGVNLVRLPVYFFGFIIVLIIAIGGPIAFREYRKKRKRKKIVRKYFRVNSRSAALNYIADQYIDSGIRPLFKLSTTTEESEWLKAVSKSEKAHSPRFTIDGPAGLVIESNRTSIKRLGIASGVLSSGNDGEILVNQSTLFLLKSFVDFVLQSDKDALVDPEEIEMTDPGE